MKHVKKFIGSAAALLAVAVSLICVSCIKKGNETTPDYGTMQIITTSTPEPQKTPEPQETEDTSALEEQQAALSHEASPEGKAETAMLRRMMLSYILLSSEGETTSDFLDVVYLAMMQAGYKPDEVSDMSCTDPALDIDPSAALPGDLVAVCDKDGNQTNIAVFTGNNVAVYPENRVIKVSRISEFAENFRFVRVLPDEVSGEEAAEYEHQCYGYQEPFSVVLTEGESKLLNGDETKLGALMADHTSELYGRIPNAVVTVKSIDTKSYQDMYVITIEYMLMEKTVYYRPSTRTFFLEVK